MLDKMSCTTYPKAERGHTPKHVMLTLAVKNLTGSTEVVPILNRFGHVMSRGQLQVIENNLAENQLHKEIDLMVSAEETLSGKGTTDCTNGIIIQNK